MKTGKYVKRAITILVLSIPNFMWGQAVFEKPSPAQIERLEIAPLQFSWETEKVQQSKMSKMDMGKEVIIRVQSRRTTPIFFVCQIVTVRTESILPRLNRYDNPAVAIGMMSSELYYREY